jgi:hypothetical protein
MSTQAPGRPLCGNCYGHLADDHSWQRDDGTWIHLCAGCHELEIDKQNAVKLAQVICLMWSAIYDHAEGRAQ